MSALYEAQDEPLLKEAIKYIPRVSSVVKIFDFFIRILFDVDKLIILVRDIINGICFNETEKITFHLLQIGLQMLVEIPHDEQVSFQFAKY